MTDIKIPHYFFGKGGLGIQAFVDVEGNNIVLIAPLREKDNLGDGDDLTDDNAYMDSAVSLVLPTWEHASRVYDALIYTAEAEDNNG